MSMPWLVQAISTDERTVAAGSRMRQGSRWKRTPPSSSSCVCLPPSSCVCVRLFGLVVSRVGRGQGSVLHVLGCVKIRRLPVRGRAPYPPGGRSKKRKTTSPVEERGSTDRPQRRSVTTTTGTRMRTPGITPPARPQLAGEGAFTHHTWLRALTRACLAGTARRTP